jgi:hypothetical protein
MTHYCKDWYESEKNLFCAVLGSLNNFELPEKKQNDNLLLWNTRTSVFVTDISMSYYTILQTSNVPFLSDL